MSMDTVNPACMPNAEAREEIIPDALASAVGLIPEMESMVNRIRNGERTLKFRQKKSFGEKVLRSVGRGSVFLTQRRFADFKYTK